MHRHLFLASSLALCAAPASAAIILTVERTGVSVDNPLLTVFNEDPLEIASMILSIGDESRNFDSAQTQDVSAGLIVSVLHPDEINNGLRSDEIEWEFQNFTLNGMFSSRLDIDSDAGPATVDWQLALFNNGELPNALWSIHFADGSMNQIMLHDEPGRDPLTPYVVTMMSSIPEPGSVFLILPVLLIGVLVRLRKLLIA